jgi:adenylate cyclase, class 2
VAGCCTTSRPRSVAGAISQPNRNIELKARDPDPGRSLGRCRELNAQDHGELWQRDTYFNVPSGRLKLREQSPGEAHLIGYERADEPQERESRYRIAPAPDPAATGSLLAAMLGVRVTVTKTRRLFTYENVRIHLDTVELLGSFIELEAVAAPGDEDLAREHELIGQLRRALDITDDRLVAIGYADARELESAGSG